jgi:hypothetical protein
LQQITRGDELVDRRAIDVQHGGHLDDAQELRQLRLAVSEPEAVAEAPVLPAFVVAGVEAFRRCGTFLMG